MKDRINRAIIGSVGLLAVFSSPAFAQHPSAPMPDHLTIARRTFFDFGPPFNYYEIIEASSADGLLRVERALVTPAGTECVQPAKIQISSATLNQSMTQLLQGKNPCTIPEKELRHERARCKRCITFSGVDITMQMNCGTAERAFRLDILDRDLFDARSQTPKITSWSMSVLQPLDQALGPGAWDQPAFQLSPEKQEPPPHGQLMEKILRGNFDSLFGPTVKISAIAQDAINNPLQEPTIRIESVSPASPLSAELPSYPPIARVAHIEGAVEANFEIGEDGSVHNISFETGARLGPLQKALSASLSKWRFPHAAGGAKGKAVVRFSLNCKPRPS